MVCHWCVHGFRLPCSALLLFLRVQRSSTRINNHLNVISSFFRNSILYASDFESPRFTFYYVLMTLTNPDEPRRALWRRTTQLTRLTPNTSPTPSPPPPPTLHARVPAPQRPRSQPDPCLHETAGSSPASGTLTVLPAQKAARCTHDLESGILQAYSTRRARSRKLHVGEPSLVKGPEHRQGIGW